MKFFGRKLRFPWDSILRVHGVGNAAGYCGSILLASIFRNIESVVHWFRSNLIEREMEVSIVLSVETFGSSNSKNVYKISLNNF